MDFILMMILALVGPFALVYLFDHDDDGVE